jgi:ATP-binding cassette subfamily B (MDR/TAP) protein 1/ATP-binding cassette subfamily B (MDR/TAP) protein 5
MKVRALLYVSILQKNIGWFDFKDNGTGILTAAMSSDTSLINGVSTESLAPLCEALFSLLVGIGIGFYFCW